MSGNGCGYLQDFLLVFLLLCAMPLAGRRYKTAASTIATNSKKQSEEAATTMTAIMTATKS